jgi:2-iminobutanoate/2-iminopropanoate deaminase
MPRTALNSPDYEVPVPGFTQVVSVPPGGTTLYVSGLTARTPDGEIASLGDVGGQARQVLRNLQTVLANAGATLDDVVQIRTFVRDLAQWPAIGEAYGEAWGETWPASTIVEINRLYDDRQLIELEVVAVVGSRQP